MPKNTKRNRKGGASPRRERHLSVRSQLRAEPDVGKLARAVVALALAQSEADAQAEKTRRDTQPDSQETDR